MSDSSKDAGTIQALLDRLNKHRLPRALELKSRVDRGEKLSENDLHFLKLVLEDSAVAQGLAARNPEFQPLVARLINLYGEITAKALENEQQT